VLTGAGVDATEQREQEGHHQLTVIRQ
jgi:hypothetical protein